MANQLGMSERQALAMMDHPHIARVLDAGETVRGRRRRSGQQGSHPNTGLVACVTICWAQRLWAWDASPMPSRCCCRASVD